MNTLRETGPVREPMYSWLGAVVISTSLLLMLTANLQAANALPPTVIEFNCPGGSANAKMVELTEDRNGDGVYDTRTTIGCDGGSTSGPWPPPPPPQPPARGLHANGPDFNHVEHASSYNSNVGFYVWIVRMYDDTVNMNLVATLEYTESSDYVFTDLTVPGINMDDDGRVEDMSKLVYHGLEVRVIEGKDKHISTDGQRRIDVLGTGEGLEIMFVSQSTKDAVIEMFNKDGSLVVHRRVMSPDKGPHHLLVDWKTLPAGTYVVRCKQAGTVNSTKVVKP